MDKRTPSITADGRYLLLLNLLLFFAVSSSNSHCTNEWCEKKSLSLKTDAKHNLSLAGYVFEALNVSIWKECFRVCVRKCLCHSFNFNELNKTKNCELNDATATLEPKALEKREGITYYEIGRSYFDKKVILVLFPAPLRVIFLVDQPAKIYLLNFFRSLLFQALACGKLNNHTLLKNIFEFGSLSSTNISKTEKKKINKIRHYLKGLVPLVTKTHSVSWWYTF